MLMISFHNHFHLLQQFGVFLFVDCLYYLIACFTCLNCTGEPIVILG